jgi:hypothetical protein
VDEIKGQPAEPFYGIQADEATDTSNREQLGLVLRYMKDNVLIERLADYPQG